MGPPPARSRHQHMAKRSGARTALLGCFSVIVVLFAWHNSAYLSAWARANSLARANSGVRASRQRQGLESPRMSYLGLQAGEGATLWDGDGDGGDPDLAREQQELEPDDDSEQPWATSGSAADPLDAAAAAAAGAAAKPTGAGAGSRPAEAAAGAAGGGLRGNAGSKPAAQRQQQQRQGQGQQGARQRPAVPKPTPLTPLEQQQGALQASLATQLDREHAALLGGGARHEPPAPRVYAPARRPTLVLYAYLGADYEHEERLGFFVRSAVREGDGAVYKIILAHPGVKKVRWRTAAAGCGYAMRCAAPAPACGLLSLHAVQRAQARPQCHRCAMLCSQTHGWPPLPSCSRLACPSCPATRSSCGPAAVATTRGARLRGCCRGYDWSGSTMWWWWTRWRWGPSCLPMPPRWGARVWAQAQRSGLE